MDQAGPGALDGQRDGRRLGDRALDPEHLRGAGVGDPAPTQGVGGGLCGPQNDVVPVDVKVAISAQKLSASLRRGVHSLHLAIRP